MGRQPRQRPVSCSFCRARKLRCSRQNPCSNCAGRGVPCDIGNAALPPVSFQQQPQPQQPAGLATVGNDAVNALLARLERLESVVQDQNKALERSRNAGFAGTATQGHPEPPRQALASTATSLSSPHSTADSPVPVQLQKFTTDALWIEARSTSQTLTDKSIADDIAFRTCPMLSVNKQAFFITTPDSICADGSTTAIKCIWLPLREEARYMTQKYFLELTYFHHIIHIPTLQAKIEELYDNLDAGRPVDKGTVLLLVSICADVCYAWSPAEDERCWFMNSKAAGVQSTTWLKAGMDMVDHVHRIAFASLACVQGITILFFVMFIIEGTARRGGDLMSRAINMARELGLHLVDKPGSDCATRLKQELTPSRKEMCRRTMWYLTATDWTLGHFCMPTEGTHIIDPRYMHVNLPANINDDDINDDEEIISHPPNVETSASYFIQRIKLADLCRDVSDLQSGLPIEPGREHYDQVLAIDARLHQFLAELPPFFSLDMTWRPEKARYKSISVAYRSVDSGKLLRKCTIHLLIRRHLVKLHLPFLARGAIDSSFAYSRRVCLESARLILHTEKRLTKETLPTMSLRSRTTMVLRCTFLASIALVIDACVQDGAAREGQPGAEEIVEAWRTLDQAKEFSVTANRILELSKLALRKQNGEHPALLQFEAHLAAQAREEQQQQQQRRRQAQSPDGSIVTPESMDYPQQDHGIEAAPGMVDENWFGLNEYMQLDNIDWNQALSGVDVPLF